jgi:hypothetical protein
METSTLASFNRPPAFLAAAAAVSPAGGIDTTAAAADWERAAAGAVSCINFFVCFILCKK